jgi:hypothetical protein
MLTSADSSAMLRQGSLMTELSGSRNAQTRQLLTAASQLADAEQQVQASSIGGKRQLRSAAVHRADQHPGGQGRRVRLRPARQAVPVGHVTMYMGGGYMIDAPQTGMDVQKIPVNTGCTPPPSSAPPVRSDRRRPP